MVGVAGAATVADVSCDALRGAGEERKEGVGVEWQGAVDGDVQAGEGAGDGDVIETCGTVARGSGGAELRSEWYGTCELRSR